MKKIFTLISMALVAMSMNAQEIWKVSELTFEESTVGDKTVKVLKDMTSAANTTATLKKVATTYNLSGGGQPDEATVKAEATTDLVLNDYTFIGKTASVTLTAVSTPNSGTEEYNVWKADGADNTKLSETNLGDECLVNFDNQYVVAGNGNPSLEAYEYYFTNSDGDPVGPRYYETYWTPGCGQLPLKGCYYKITAATKGDIIIGFFLNKNLVSNPLYIVDGSTKELLAKDKIGISAFRQNCNFEVEQGGTTKLYDYTLGDDYKVVVVNGGGTNRPLYGYLILELEANKDYYMFSPMSQMGIYGFYFDGGDPSGIANVNAQAANANAPRYNLAGQRVENGFKGIAIQNGRKFVIK